MFSILINDKEDEKESHRFANATAYILPLTKI